MCDYQSKAHRYCVFQHRTFKHVAALRSYFSSKHGKEKVHRPTKPRKAQIRPQEAPLWQNKPWLVPGETLGYEVPVFSFRKSTGFLRPVRACVGSLNPSWGNDPPPPGQGAVWAPQGRVWQKEKKTAQPGKQLPAQTANTSAFGFPLGERFPQKPAVERGVKKEQVKGPGSPEASRAGSLRPAEPSVPGFFPGVNFPVFRGRFGGLGVTDGVRKQEFPGGKPFLRVSPPGSTKG